MQDYENFIKDGKRMVLCTFSTKHLQKKDIVRYYYALKGRDGKSGIVKRAKIKHIGKGVLLVPYTYEEEVKQFFKVWNLDYTTQNVIADHHIEIRGIP